MMSKKSVFFRALLIVNVFIMTGCTDKLTDFLGFEEINVVDEKKPSHSVSQIIGDMETLPPDTDADFRCFQLTDEEKVAYTEISDGLKNYDDSIELSCKINEASLKKVYESVIYSEESQMFCTSHAYKYSYLESEDIVNFIEPCYNFTPEECEQIQGKIDEQTQVIKKEVTSGMSDIEKIKVIHDYIIKKCEYADLTKCTEEEVVFKMEKEHFGDAYGALIGGSAICEGYSRAFKYICNSFGIGCELVSGTGDNTEHMWNMVQIDDRWYHVDVTWDDPVINGVSDESTVVYDYFCLPDEKILEDHIIEEGVLLYPRCENTLS